MFAKTTFSEGHKKHLLREQKIEDEFQACLYNKWMRRFYEDIRQVRDRPFDSYHKEEFMESFNEMPKKRKQHMYKRVQSLMECTPYEVHYTTTGFSGKEEKVSLTLGVHDIQKYKSLMQHVWDKHTSLDEKEMLDIQSEAKSIEGLYSTLWGEFGLLKSWNMRSIHAGFLFYKEKMIALRDVTAFHKLPTVTNDVYKEKNDDGLEVQVRLMRMGFFNGYVQVAPTSPLYKFSWEDFEGKQLSEWITYTESGLIGFDCAHSWDFSLETRADRMTSGKTFKTFKTFEIVLERTRKLANDLTCLEKDFPDQLKK